MFYTERRYYTTYPNIEITFKSFENFGKAVKYVKRYAGGHRFDSVEMTDEDDNVILWIYNSGGGTEINKELWDKYSGGNAWD